MGMQISVYHNGAQYDLCAGTRQGSVSIDEASIMNWQSTAKPVAAVAIALLVDRGLCSFEAPVCTYVPEFGCNGKGPITVWHLLTHTSGIPFCDLELLHRSPPAPWDEFIRVICQSKPESAAGEKAGYHPTSSWFILGEIVRRVTGRAFDRFVREDIFEPLGMEDCFIGSVPLRLDPRSQPRALHQSAGPHPLSRLC